ncbi:unnamed protein product [Chrysoparadoxa australica]
MVVKEMDSPLKRPASRVSLDNLPEESEATNPLYASRSAHGPARPPVGPKPAAVAASSHGTRRKGPTGALSLSPRSDDSGDELSASSPLMKESAKKQKRRRPSIKDTMLGKLGRRGSQTSDEAGKGSGQPLPAVVSELDAEAMEEWWEARPKDQLGNEAHLNDKFDDLLASVHNNKTRDGDVLTNEKLEEVKGALREALLATNADPKALEEWWQSGQRAREDGVESPYQLLSGNLLQHLNRDGAAHEGDAFRGWLDEAPISDEEHGHLKQSLEVMLISTQVEDRTFGDWVKSPARRRDGVVSVKQYQSLLSGLNDHVGMRLSPSHLVAGLEEHVVQDSPASSNGGGFTAHMGASARPARDNSSDENERRYNAMIHGLNDHLGNSDEDLSVEPEPPEEDSEDEMIESPLDEEEEMEPAKSEKGLMLPEEEEDVAAMVGHNWGSNDDGEFVMPWYTYLTRVIMVPTTFLMFYFIYWRWSNYALNDIWWKDIMALTFMACESFCFAFSTYQWVWFWNLKFRKQVLQRHLGLSDRNLPTFDFLIPCYSEPPEIVEMTLKACFDFDYPHDKINAWICDDGKSQAMKEMVDHVKSEYTGPINIQYVARTKIKGVPHHAKAGNLNNVILNQDGNCPSNGDLISVLDCDMLPEPCFPRTVAPFFYKLVDDESDGEGGAEGIKTGKTTLSRTSTTSQPSKRKVAVFDHSVGLLQTPQAFYNLDRKDLLGQSYAFFYDCIMSGWDGCGCTPCCGTGVTFNRTAMVSIGGFAYGSITEDFKTSMNLCARGFTCKYFLKRMTRGVCPKELSAFMKQRLRWATGAVQILKGQNPLYTKGLHWRAKWLYWATSVSSTFIVPLVIMSVFMYATILTETIVSLGPTTFEDYLKYGAGTMFLMFLMNYLMAWRLSWNDFFRGLQDTFTCFPIMIRAVMIGFGGLKLEFVVTGKGVDFDLVENLWLVAPHIVAYLVSFAAMCKVIPEMLALSGLINIPWTPANSLDQLWFSIVFTAFLVSGRSKLYLVTPPVCPSSQSIHGPFSFHSLLLLAVQWIMLPQTIRMFIYSWQKARIKVLIPQLFPWVYLYIFKYCRKK